MTASALVLTAAGINCDRELGEAFALAGARVTYRHLNELMAAPEEIDAFDLIGLPGGFSYGDAVAAGRIAAQLMRQTLYSALVRAVERGVPIIAPCNGFQIAVQIGLLPGPAPGEPWPEEAPAPVAALTRNTSARFIDRWTEVHVPAATRCVWTQGLVTPGLLPIAHGEGRFTVDSEATLEALAAHGQIALRYAPSDNPNGSVDDIAGICDASGLVFGLMPHPERYTRWTQHPFWTRLGPTDREGAPLGLSMFHQAVAHARGAATI